MVNHTFYLIHLDDDVGDVSFIPRAIRQKFLERYPDGFVDISENDEETDYVITLRIPPHSDSTFEIRYLVCEKREHLQAHLEQEYAATALYVLDVMIEPRSDGGLEAWELIRAKGVPAARALFFTAYPREFMERFPNTANRPHLMSKNPNRDDLLRRIFSMMAIWPAVSALIEG